MDKYLKRSAAKDQEEPSASCSKGSKTSSDNKEIKKKPVYTAAEKTVKKWMKDLNIDLEMKTGKTEWSMK